MSREEKPKDRVKSRIIYVLEKALDKAIMQAASVYPMNADPYDIKIWADTLKMYVIEIVKRQRLHLEEKYRDLPLEEQIKVILEKSWDEVKKIQKRQKRQAEATAYLSLELSGPPPRSPSKDDESSERSHSDNRSS